MKRIDLQRTLWITGTLSVPAYLALLFLGDARPRMVEFLVLYGAVFVLYALALRPLLKKQAPEFSATPAQSGKWPREIWIIAAFAVLFRLLLLAADSHLSDDIWRYLWDGRVWSAGINPYRYTPNAEALIALRDHGIYPNVNHPQIPTIYPPVLQGLFRLLYSIGPSAVIYKIAFTLFDLATLAVLILLLQHRRRDVRWSLVYAWNPLVIVETAGSGHLDAVGVFFLVLFFLLVEMQRFKSAAASLAAAVLTKFAPLLLLSFLALHRRKKPTLLPPLLVIALILLAYLPFLDAGAALFKAATVYSTKWSFNASLFWALFSPLKMLLPQDLVRGAILAKDMTPDAQTLASTRVDLALLYTKAALGLAYAVIYGWVFYRAWRVRTVRQADLPQLWLVLFGLLCIISPTLHPWYLIWLLPVLAIYPVRAGFLLTGLIMLSYLILPGYFYHSVWQEHLSTRLVIFIPFYAVLAHDLYRLRKAG